MVALEGQRARRGVVCPGMEPLSVAIGEVEMRRVTQNYGYATYRVCRTMLGIRIYSMYGMLEV
jgi:hypothetical protein